MFNAVGKSGLGMLPCKIIMTLALVKATSEIASILRSFLSYCSLRTADLREKLIDDPAKIMERKIGSI